MVRFHFDLTKLYPAAKHDDDKRASLLDKLSMQVVNTSGQICFLFSIRSRISVEIVQHRLRTTENELRVTVLHFDRDDVHMSTLKFALTDSQRSS